MELTTLEQHTMLAIMALYSNAYGVAIRITSSERPTTNPVLGASTPPSTGWKKKALSDRSRRGDA